MQCDRCPVFSSSPLFSPFAFLKSTLFRLALFHLCRKIPGGTSLSCFADILFPPTSCVVRLCTNGGNVETGTRTFKSFFSLVCLIFHRRTFFLYHYLLQNNMITIEIINVRKYSRTFG